MATAVWRTGNSIDGQAIGQREELGDVIYRIDPDETPIWSNGRKETSEAIFTEWLVQDLAAATTANRLTEGADASYATPTAATRLGNYHQISGAAVSISNTLNVVNKAGRDEEVAYQKVLKALEVRRDIETITTSDQARASADPRVTAGLTAWITNTSVNGGGAATGDGTDYFGQTTAGTGRALSLALIDEAMLAAYNDGGKPDMMVMSPTNKQNFSGLSSGSVVSNEYNMTKPGEAAIIGSASMYLTDFGTLDVVVDRFMGNDRVFLLDSGYFGFCTLPGRNFVVNDIAPIGDAQRFQIICEWALKMHAPKAHGAVYNLNGS